MKNQEVAKRFVNGETKAKGNHMFVAGNIVYSYGFWFPIAIRLNSPEGFKYILNKRGYSLTTSRHKSCVRSCIDEKDIILETERIEDYEDAKDVKELKIEGVIKNNLKVIEEIGLKEGYLLRNRLTGKIVKVKHIHQVYGWVECEGLKQDFSNIEDFEVAKREMILRSLK